MLKVIFWCFGIILTFSYYINIINCYSHNFNNDKENEILNNISTDKNNDSGGVNNIARGLMDTAKDVIDSPAGQMAVHFAKEMISRSAGNSQILSLNLTNLLILVLLKALIFAAGLIGTGSHTFFNGRDGRRNYNDNPQGDFFKNGETPLIIGYLAGEGSGQYDCLYKAACTAPHTATEYVNAAKAIIRGAEMIDTDIPYDHKYLETILGTERAILEGLENAPCNSIYHCRI